MHSHSVVSYSLLCYGLWSTGLLCPRDSPGNKECIAMPSSRGSSWPRNQTHVFYISCIGRRVIYHWATWESPILPIYIYICRHCSWHQDLSPNNTNQLLSWSSHSIVRKTGNKKQQKNQYTRTEFNKNKTMVRGDTGGDWYRIFHVSIAEEESSIVGQKVQRCKYWEHFPY